MNNKNIKKADFDEYQRNIRYKYGFRSFILTMMLLILNMIVVNFYNYATISVQTLFIMVISSIYFTVGVAVKGAYIPFKDKKNYILGSLGLLILGGVNIVIRVVTSTDISFYFENGAFKDSFGGILLGFYLIFTAIITYYSYIKNK